MRWQLQLWSVYGKILPKSEDEFRSKIPDMEEAWQFPCCWSAVDGCHIPIKCPPGGLESCKEYHNFKNFFSMMLMVWLIPSIDFSFFSPLIYGIKSRTRTISPKLARKWVPFLNLPWYLGMQHFRCNHGWWSRAWMPTLHYNKDITTTGWAEPEWWQRVLLGNLKEGSGFCLEDASAARRILEDILADDLPW